MNYFVEEVPSHMREMLKWKIAPETNLPLDYHRYKTFLQNKIRRLAKTATYLLL